MCNQELGAALRRRDEAFSPSAATPQRPAPNSAIRTEKGVPMTDTERLAAYDRMYADLLRERDKVLSDMDRLRAAGKNRGATYQQLIARKLTVMDLIGRFEIYGIRE